MQTAKWGPPCWEFFHAVAHNYDPSIDDIKDYRSYYELIGKVLPCKYCRDSYPQFFKELPIEKAKGSQKEMAFWAYQMHCKVNDKLRKQGFLKTPDPSFEEIYAKYEQWRAGCSSGVVGPAGMCGGARVLSAHQDSDLPVSQRQAFPGTRCQAQTGGGKRCSRKYTHNDYLCSQHHEKKISRSKSKKSDIKHISKTSSDADYFFRA
jgi:hypothetical protein